jgi:molybdopterin converting factor small subunit
MGIFDRLRGGTVRIHVVIKGRIGDGWHDVDEHVRVPAGTTLDKLLEIADSAHIPLREALASSPHLTETMMLNGERCPFTANAERVLVEGDEIYLLAPLAGG